MGVHESKIGNSTFIILHFCRFSPFHFQLDLLKFSIVWKQTSETRSSSIVIDPGRFSVFHTASNRS